MTFVLFAKRVCGPIANSHFDRRPDENTSHPARSKATYYNAAAAIQNVINQLAMAA